MIETISQDQQKQQATTWFLKLRDEIINEFLLIEQELSGQLPKVNKRQWSRSGGGGGESSIIYGKVFEKAGVNVSTVYGKFSDKFASEITGAIENDGEFWASGISLVVHTQSPFIPAIHMNTRFLCTSKSWFGGGIDLTPIYNNEEDNQFFHNQLRKACDKFNPKYYRKFKKQCDEYFFLPHRNEARGIGGIFYDHLNSGVWQDDFNYTQEIGRAFLSTYPVIVRKNIHKKWTEEERNFQLIKRGRYVEFNLIYDRGTRFGLMTGGNINAIMMSMPPLVKWE